ncbi:hypothetical protein Pmani_016707 [Petrolisthes manimaculis]|uniref:Uncharacterized protein n=1 Tax=Petrolisthes manimaculis TaxID=1843537 RepID=A0AAE1U6F7_9EUCA|nr:hypothetical protein Pmani_016707 [Petrolisthes manimaculis]
MKWMMKEEEEVEEMEKTGKEEGKNKENRVMKWMMKEEDEMEKIDEMVCKKELPVVDEKKEEVTVTEKK